MILVTVFYIFSFLYLQTTEAQSNEEFYTAAVVGYRNSYDARFTPLENMLNNSIQYRSYILQAKNQGADIIVFPEYGLTSLDALSIFNVTNKEEMLPLTTMVPLDKYPKMNPCDNPNISDIVSQVVTNLSCEAKRYRIYIVVNLAERTDVEDNNLVEFYNTDLVFDRTGSIIARYRKVNLFMEPFFTSSKVETVTFETDFGVTFGIFTCFDILFEQPAKLLVRKNITDFVYPTAWLSELPFLTALQVQSGWARANRVNLLASGLVDPKQYMGGSGIYSVQNMTSSVPVFKQSTMMVARVPKIKKDTEMYIKVFDNTRNTKSVGVTAPGLHTLVTDMKKFGYSYVDLKEEVNKGKVMHGNFSCSYYVKISDRDSKDMNYKVVAYQGTFQAIDNNKYPTQICGVVACSNDSLASCGRINYGDMDVAPSFPTLDNVTLEANMATRENSVVIPSVVGYRLNTIQYEDYSFTHEKTTKILLNKPQSNKIMTFGIVAQSYPNSANILYLSKIIIFLSTILFIKQKL